MDFFNTGIMKQTCFNSLVKNTYLTREEIHDLLVKFDLASVIDSDQQDKENQEKNRLFIPSLLSNENEEKIKNIFEDFKKRENCMGFYFSIQKQDGTSQLFSHFLSKLATTTELYKGNSGIHFDVAFSAKIEQRTLGLVGGLAGTFKWTGKSLEYPDDIEFLILDFDNDIRKSEFTFAKHKVDNAKFVPTEIFYCFRE